MTTLEHGETYGSLKVIEKIKAAKSGRIKYRVGCVVCGFSNQFVRASRFDRGQERCVKCRHARAKEA